MIWVPSTPIEQRAGKCRKIARAIIGPDVEVIRARSVMRMPRLPTDDDEPHMVLRKDTHEVSMKFGQHGGATLGKIIPARPPRWPPSFGVGLSRVFYRRQMSAARAANMTIRCSAPVSSLPRLPAITVSGADGA